jgi:hypothetical protein
MVKSFEIMQQRADAMRGNLEDLFGMPEKKRREKIATMQEQYALAEGLMGGEFKGKDKEAALKYMTRLTKIGGFGQSKSFLETAFGGSRKNDLDKLFNTDILGTGLGKNGVELMDMYKGFQGKADLQRFNMRGGTQNLEKIAATIDGLQSKQLSNMQSLQNTMQKQQEEMSKRAEEAKKTMEEAMKRAKVTAEEAYKKLEELQKGAIKFEVDGSVSVKIGDVNIDDSNLSSMMEKAAVRAVEIAMGKKPAPEAPFGGRAPEFLT